MNTLLQLFPFSEYLEGELVKRFDVVSWFGMTNEERSDWLADRADTVVAAATAGHIGCPTDLLNALPNLKIIATNGVGFDKVDVPLAASRGVYVSTTPGLLSEDVADLAVGLIIALLRRIPEADNFVRDGRWSQGEMPLARKVSGRTFGVLGLGAIGRAIAARLSPFGEVHYCGREKKPVTYHYHDNVRNLAQACDVLIVACAANADTFKLVDKDVLAALGSDGWLVNISRGVVVDETALITALENEVIAGAALDVYADEPRVPQALVESGKVVLTPHIASATEETRKEMADCVIANLDAVMAGKKAPTALRDIE
jgi:lactate dehydrogenase-like 2-hydroxyacid dehydrogenase